MFVASIGAYFFIMRLKHIPTGQEGDFVKSYFATGYPGETTQISLDDGRVYFAPDVEFQTVKTPKTYELKN